MVRFCRAVLHDKFGFRFHISLGHIVPLFNHVVPKMLGIPLVLPMHGFGVRLRPDPQASIVQCGVVQGQPQSQTGLTRFGPQKGGILMRRHGAAHAGRLENVHALRYDGVAPLQFLMHQATNLVGSAVVVKGVGTTTMTTIARVVKILDAMQRVARLVERLNFGVRALVFRFQRLCSSNRTFILISSSAVLQRRGFAKIMDPIGAGQKVIPPRLVLDRVGAKVFHFVLVPFLLDETDHFGLHGLAFVQRSELG
mmetsp:Transcript_18044/g.49133  ORF Transcript_18044/g.49133 Transcript_18044/m.49133 type:complete len:253 (+) Transcript_18044:489-1247(+)